MAIKPVDIPSAAGLDYGKGDVRHFSQGDDQSVPGLSNPTRHLAERDNRLAEKLNEVISTVNNQEQFVPLVVPRTAIPPNDQVVVINQRIPAGFEARVLSAAVASSPVSTDVELNVYYNEGFGGTTGTSVVSTSTEFSGGIQFYGTGEFIVTLVNKGAQTLEVSGSVLLTVRPLGAEGTLLVGSVIQGPKGDPGVAGVPGPAGPPGTGGTGSPGLVWQGAWSNATAYNPNDAVSRTSGGITSSYIALVGNTNVDPVGNPATWDPLAVGSTGPTGPSGGGSSEGAVFSSTSVNGTLVTGSDVSSDAITGYQNVSPSTTYYFPIIEQFIGTTAATEGCAMLFGVLRANVTGSGTIILPKNAYGAKIDYNAGSINVTACANGTIPVVANEAAEVTCIQTGADRYTLKVLNSVPIRVAVSIFGAELVP